MRLSSKGPLTALVARDGLRWPGLFCLTVLIVLTSADVIDFRAVGTQRSPADSLPRTGGVASVGPQVSAPRGASTERRIQHSSFLNIMHVSVTVFVKVTENLKNVNLECNF